MIPEALNILNRSEEHLREIKTKKGGGRERNNQMIKKGRKAQQNK
jgi:hypothetical protein